MGGVSILQLMDLISELLKIPFLLLDRQGQIIYASPCFNQAQQALLGQFCQALVKSKGPFATPSEFDLAEADVVCAKVRMQSELFYLFAGHLIRPEQEQKVLKTWGKEVGQLLISYNLHPYWQQQLTQLQAMVSILGKMISQEYQIKQVSRELKSVSAEQLAAGVEKSLMQLEKENKLMQLTRRQLEVLMKLAEAKTNSEIAAELHISEKTVKVHISKIIQKLAVKDRVGAALYYVSHS